MSADIEKLAIFDDRIVQTRPKYAVCKGALSLTNAPFTAIAQTQTQHTYNVYVPSENVFVDRAMEWSSTCNNRIDVMISTDVGQFPPGVPLLQLGVDGSLAAFPLNSLCATMTATINDTTVVINSQDVLKEVIRLTDYKEHRLQRTCPTMLDKYLLNSDGLNSFNDPISTYTNGMSQDYYEVPNGAWSNIVFTTPAGAPLVGNGSYVSPSGMTTNFVNGVPVTTVQGAGPNVNGVYSVFVRWRSTEKLVLSPFIFADAFESDTGLFGINNIQLVMNMRDPSRAFRLRDFTSVVGGQTQRKQYYSGTLAAGGATPAPGAPAYTGPAVSYNTTAASVFTDSVINVQFLTPSLDIPLPPKSVVPYMEFPRFITAPQNSTIAAGASGQLQSQTITLPQIPDLLIIYVKAGRDGAVAGTADFPIPDPTFPQFGDAYLPLQTSSAGNRTVSPLSINFDNFSGLLSSHTSEELYHMTVRNGLEMDWNTWSGKARSNVGLGTQISPVGGFLVLKPSQDITLQSGQAPSLVGNFTLQFNISVENRYPFSVQPQIFVITANSGFFETIRGSSRIIKGVLSEQDIISAPLAPTGTHGALKRLVGSGFMSSLANVMRRAGEVYHATKPAVSAVKGMLPEGKVKDVMSAVGYGQPSGRSGGMRSGGLAKRLM